MILNCNEYVLPTVPSLLTWPDFMFIKRISFQQGIPTLVSKLPGYSDGTQTSLDIYFLQNGSNYCALDSAILVQIKLYKSPFRLWNLSNTVDHHCNTTMLFPVGLPSSVTFLCCRAAPGTSPVNSAQSTRVLASTGHTWTMCGKSLRRVDLCLRRTCSGFPPLSGSVDTDDYQID